MFCLGASAQISVTGSSLTYTQDFNTLDTNGSAQTNMPTGWSFHEWNGTGTTTTYRAGSGSVNSGDTYSFGAQGSPERALGSLGSGSVGKINYGATFVNNTGVAINSMNITFKSEQWRVGDTNSVNVDTVRFYYSTSASVTDTTFTAWTEVTGLMMTSIITSASSTSGNALNGNTTSVVKTAVVNINVPAGSNLVLRWYDYNSAGSDDGLAVDSLTAVFTTSAPPVNNYKPLIASLVPVNNATNVSVSTNSLAVTFDRNITAGTGQIVLRNETDQSNVIAVAANSANVTISGKTATITGFSSLVAGKTYHVRIDSTCFDTAGYRFSGIYDSTSWRFSTVPASTTVTMLNETFDAACGAGPIPAGWSRQSVTGNQQWNCYTVASSGNVVYRMNGFQGGNNVNEDWLVTPRMDLSAPNTLGFRFSMWKRFAGTEPQIMLSTDFAGDVTTANWTPLTITTGPADTNAWKMHNISIVPYKATPFFIAFKYTSTASDGYDLRIDSVMTMTTTGVFNLNEGNKMPVVVIGKAGNEQVNVAFSLGNAAAVTASIYDLSGREVYRNRFNGKAGDNRITLVPGNLRSGMYLVRLSDGTTYGVAKAIIE